MKRPSPVNLVIFDDPTVDGHLPISDLPETPKRTQAIRAALRAQFPESADNVHWFNPPIPPAPVTLSIYVHTVEYLTTVMKALNTAKEGKSVVAVHADNDEALVSAGTHQALEAAVGAVLSAVRLIGQGHYLRAFCNIRPPGHHACEARAMGFCILNNVAIAVKYALHVPDYNVSKVAIVDWDAHHGNGTQSLFEGDPRVMYTSLHMDGFYAYPDTGASHERGHHDNVRNYNLQPGAGRVQVTRIFRKKLLKALAAFQPDLIVISCGFDAHTLDPVGQLDFDTETYAFMTRQLVDFAKVHCGGRMLSVLEGGYCPKALAESAVAHVQALAQ